MHMLQLGVLPHRCAVTALRWLASVDATGCCLDRLLWYYGISQGREHRFSSLAGNLACSCLSLRSPPFDKRCCGPGYSRGHSPSVYLARASTVEPRTSISKYETRVCYCQYTVALIGMPLLLVLRLHRFFAKHCTRSYGTPISHPTCWCCWLLML